MSTITAAERKRLADLAGINEQYLYQCLTGRGTMEAKEAVRVAAVTGLKRWQLRPKDWHEVWPELIGADGAPELATDPASSDREPAGG